MRQMRRSAAGRKKIQKLAVGDPAEGWVWGPRQEGVWNKRCFRK